ncbi:MAG: hypothetical protein HY908_25450 [Myxococcales bacterium]|nr:hypothetical protein [Myxococcales bacterium]
MTSDWPYPDLADGQARVAAPTWTCPDDTCTCHTHAEESERYELSIMLCAPGGTRMAGARCRVFVGGRLVNADAPNADPAGWITVPVDRKPEQALVEWAPADCPVTPGYPYRKLCHVAYNVDNRDEGARRRLHNLGFSDGRLADCVFSFQRTYGLGPETGRVPDIEGALYAYHDAAMLPASAASTAVATPAGAGASSRRAELVSEPPPPAPTEPAPPQAPPAAPATYPRRRRASSGTLERCGRSTTASRRPSGTARSTVCRTMQRSTTAGIRRTAPLLSHPV